MSDGTRQRVHVLYNKRDADGFGSAHVAWRRLGDQATYTATSRDCSTTPSIHCDDTVYILDLSPPQAFLTSHAEAGCTIVVIDHHPSTEHLVASSRVTIRYTPFESACTATWRFFFPDIPVPWLYRMIEDRALWRWALPTSRAVTAAIASHPATFAVWDTFTQSVLERDGAAITRNDARRCAMLARHAYWVAFEGYVIPVVNSMILMDDLCTLVLETHPDAPFTACWYRCGEVYHVALRRSPVATTDVGALARRYQGQGHPAAAGFTTTRDPWQPRTQAHP